MKIIIVGAGEVGRHMALSLVSEGRAVTVIDRDAETCRELEGQIDGRVVAGDGSDPSLLAECDVAACDVFLSLTSDMNANLVSCSVAKQLGASTVICRGHAEMDRHSLLLNYRQHFRLDYLFSTERLAAVELAKWIRNPASLVVEEIAQGRIEMQQVLVLSGSEAAGKTLRELGLPSGVRIGTVSRGDEGFIPDAETQLSHGDRITLFGSPRDLGEIASRLGKGRERETSPKVVIFGGSDYGYALAQSLEAWPARVRIFERDATRCEMLSENLEKAEILNIDATSLAALREEQVGEADYFVATSPNDEDNVMTCLQAHSLGANTCLTLIHRADYADAISGHSAYLGIRSAVSPREATRRDLMRFVTSANHFTFKSLPEGDVIEVRVPPNCRLAGKKLHEVAWPTGSVVVALLRKERAFVPGRDDTIEGDDFLFAMVNRRTAKKFVRLVNQCV